MRRFFGSISLAARVDDGAGEAEAVGWRGREWRVETIVGIVISGGRRCRGRDRAPAQDLFVLRLSGRGQCGVSLLCAVARVVEQGGD